MPQFYARLARRFHSRPLTQRRDFLKIAGGGLLLSQHLPAAAAAISLRLRVVVIGAGLGGLACAHEMLAAGFDVTVLESRFRVGGRVLSFHDLVPDKPVEGGAELIGANHPTWLAYAEKFGLSFNDVSDDDDLEMPIVIGGRRIGRDEARRLFLEMDTAFAELTEMSAAIDLDRPWAGPGAAAWDRRNLADWIDGLSISDSGKRLIGLHLAADNGVDNRRASLLGMLAAVRGGGGERFWLESEAYRCAGGNDRLARKLAEAIGEDRILLGSRVEHVRYSPDEAAGRTARVTCADGRRLECDFVVSAVPPSVWRGIQWSPQLPPRLQRQQMGNAVKYLTAVKSRFWREEGFSQYAMSDGLISQTWESTDGQAPANEDADNEAAFGFTAFSGGPQAVNCLRLPADRRDEAYTAEFERLQPGFRENRITSRFMDWPRDPDTQCGYSFPAPGQITSIGPTLHDGLGNLQFCGEHTCYRFPGYMEGALFSGAALAKRMAEQYGLVGAADD